ncbi:hypothetical protein B0H17DRAFT_1144543 [Mycena rosella]|uniref:Uncharacterized protein n=1 Tax=Mycena rosella TaxID=1033263 RepID=A0AAD7CT65_MYCRO|nr:hypothetical protein B0H17DRAFT_1144543 [Mycena rosella]
MGCGRREADSGKLSKIAGERVAQRRRRWDSEALRVISGEGVDEIVNTFANVLRITHDGSVVPRKLGGAVFFMGIIKQGSIFVLWVENPARPLMMGWKAIHFPPDLRCIIARSGGTTDGFDGVLIVPGLCIYSVAAQYGRNGTFGAFGRKAKQRQMIGYHRGKRHPPIVINGYLRPITRLDFVVIFGVLIIRDSTEPAACGGSGVDGIRARTQHGARSGGGGGVDGISARPDGAACTHDLGGASTVGCCDYTPYYFGDFMVTGRGTHPFDAKLMPRCARAVMATTTVMVMVMVMEVTSKAEY